MIPNSNERASLINDLVTLMVRQRLELPEPNLEPNEDGDICCPGCGDMVPACYFGHDDVCRVCFREGVSQ